MEELNVYYIAYKTESGMHWRITETKLNLDSSEGLLQWIEDEEKTQGTRIVPIFLKNLTNNHPTAPQRSLEDDVSNQDYTEQHSTTPWSKPTSTTLDESIALKTVQALRDLGWRDPKELQENINELGEGRSTMLVNFGPKGKCRAGLINSGDRLTSMITKVFYYYEELINDNMR